MPASCKTSDQAIAISANTSLGALRREGLPDIWHSLRCRKRGSFARDPSCKVSHDMILRQAHLGVSA